ncbi:MAG: hypothetical protein ACK5NF_03220 [Bacilli bacterium]
MSSFMESVIMLALMTSVSLMGYTLKKILDNLQKLLITQEVQQEVDRKLIKQLDELAAVVSNMKDNQIRHDVEIIHLKEANGK